MTEASGVEAAKAYAERTFDGGLDDLIEFLAIPSISAMPDHHTDVRRAARWLAGKLEQIGMETVEVHETQLHPIVTASWQGAGPNAPTVLVYCHYDVQPADPLHEWSQPPFDPVVTGGRVWARGASDDKGQLHVHLRALESYLGTSQTLPVNVRVLFDGEEEIGSPSLEAFLREHRGDLSADIAIVSDTKMLSEDVPTVGHGLRGIVYFQIRLTGPSHDLHSGGYGGAVANPVNALTRLLASLQDATGRVTIPGFYDRVREISPADQQILDALPWDDDAWSGAIGVSQTWGEHGFATLQRLWHRPTLDVNGIWGGYSGAGPKTVIPAEAGAKFSCRLVLDQDPQEIRQLVTDHIQRIAPDGVDMTVEFVWGAAPVVTPLRHPAIMASIAAIEAAYGKRPLFQREGGSIPAVALIAEELGLRTLLLGFGLTDANTHGPNEWFSLRQHRRGVETVITLLSELAAVSPDELRSG